MNDNISAIVLAAGLGTRMKSELPKVLHRICGKSLVAHVLQNLKDAGVSDVAVITGYGSELVRQELGEGYSYYLQTQLLGTAHAVMQAAPFLSSRGGRVLVLCGDAPLQDGKTLSDFADYCEKEKLDLGVLTAALTDPASYGRILRKNGALERIVEKKDCTPEQVKIPEINSGTYCFDADKLLSILDQFKTENAQKEYYLTDAVALFRERGWRIGAYLCENQNIVKAVNDRFELAQCEEVMRHAINRAHMENGVHIIDPRAAYLDRDVVIGAGTELYPGCVITGNTVIGKNNRIYSSRIHNCVIGNDNLIDASTLEDSTVGDQVKIGPYAHLRPGTVLESRVRVGNFVEVKNSLMKEGAKASHLTYVGDGEVGRDVNLGCGIVFVNYDGVNKHRTVIEDGAFVGCNVNLIAPVTVGKNALIAAGSTVTEDVEEDALYIARSKPVVKSGYRKKR